MDKNGRSRLPLVKPSTLRFIEESRKAPDYSLFDLLHGLVYGRFTYLYIRLGLGEHPLTKRVLPAIWRATRPVRRVWRSVRGRGVRGADRTGGASDTIEGTDLTPPEQSSGSPSPSTKTTSMERGEKRGRWANESGTHADGYHGKVVPLDAARRLVTVRENISLPDLEQVIPYPRARALILQNPESIAVIDCPCRSARPDPCLPLDVCLIVGEPFVSFVVDHNAKKSRRISQAEAERILEETDARGNVHHAFFKDAMLGRFYAICNCCDCCCGAMQSQRRGTPMLAASGYVCRVDEDLCIGCGECAERCQFHAITLPDGITSRIDAEACMGCGVCVNACVQGALSLERDPAKGEPLEIQKLMAMTV